MILCIASAARIHPPRRRWGSAAPLLCIAIATATPAYDVHFDYTSFDNANTPGANPHFGQAQFNVLNYPSINGNFMMTSTDNHRPEMVANGNALAEFYNNFNADYNHPTAERRTPTAEAAFINSYVTTNSTKNTSLSSGITERKNFRKTQVRRRYRR